MFRPGVVEFTSVWNDIWPATQTPQHTIISISLRDSVPLLNIVSDYNGERHHSVRIH